MKITYNNIFDIERVVNFVKTNKLIPSLASILTPTRGPTRVEPKTESLLNKNASQDILASRAKE